jgi:hypothetical protein
VPVFRQTLPLRSTTSGISFLPSGFRFMPSGIRLAAEAIFLIAVSIRVVFLDARAVAERFSVAPTGFHPATVAVFWVPEAVAV